MDTQSPPRDAALFRLRKFEPGVYQLLLAHTKICHEVKNARLKKAEIRLTEGVAKAKQLNSQAGHEAWTVWRAAVHLVAQRCKTQHTEARQRMQDAVSRITATRDRAMAPSLQQRTQTQSEARHRFDLERQLAADLEMPSLAAAAEHDLEVTLLVCQEKFERDTAAAMQTYKHSLEQILDQYNQELAEINRVQSAFTAPFDRDRDIALVDAGRVLEDAGRHLQAEYAQDVDDIDGKVRDCLLRRKAALATLSEAAELSQFFEEENRRMLRELEEVNHRA
jgi:hypothetical protein